jgi:DNA invertase Pin-like site-specific DNA recombinase
MTALDQMQRQEPVEVTRHTTALYGESNPACRLTDDDVERMRDLHENHGIGYRRLARLFQCSKAQVRRICNYHQRV